MELKPCPCCGSEARASGWGDTGWVMCSNAKCGLATDPCMADTGDEAKAHAAKIWNRRVRSDTETELLAACQKLVKLGEAYEAHADEWFHHNSELLVDARAAIAKAKRDPINPLQERNDESSDPT